MPADPAPGKAIVLYDGECPLCRRTAAILRKLDWLGRLHFQSARDTALLPSCEVPLEPKRLLEEMHVVTPDRRFAYAGYPAVRWLAWRLPLFIPVAPFLYLPGVLWLGNHVYRWIARNRMGLVPCRDGFCHVELKRK